MQEFSAAQQDDVLPVKEIRVENLSSSRTLPAPGPENLLAVLALLIVPVPYSLSRERCTLGGARVYTGISSGTPMPSDAPHLLIRDSGGSVREVMITKAPFTLGRQPDSDLVLLDHRISRRHARILQDANGWMLEDCASRHGTYVNGERVELYPLKDGDRINLGVSDAYQLTFVSAGASLQNLLQKMGTAPESATPMLQHLNLLLQLAQMLHRAAALEEVLAALVDSALRMSGAERGILFLVDDAGELKNRMIRGGDPMAVAGESGARELVERVMKSRRQEVMLEDSARAGSGYETVAVSTGQRGALAIPLQKLPVRDFTGDETIRQAAPELLGVLYLENRSRPAAITRLDRQALDTLAVEGAMIIENARLLRLTREQERNRHEMSLARSIQQSLLPRELPQALYFQVHAVTTPCRTVGGDFYDVIALPGNRLGLTVADVSGKGLPAAMMAVTLQGAFSALAAADTGLEELFRRINLFLCERTPPEMYATVFYAVLDPSGRFDFVNAGHVPPLHVRAAGPAAFLDAPGFPLGMFPKADYEVTSVQLEPGDQILIFSDGLTEAQNESLEMLGETRLQEVVENCKAASPEELCRNLVAAAEKFAGAAPQTDDLTVAALRYTPPVNQSAVP
ncbi:MAG: SpoIIE family protein phosphatase [Terriglobia bacterium]